MAQEAYDFARFETQVRTPQPVQPQQQEERLRSVKGGKGVPSAMQKIFSNMLQVVTVIAFFALACAFLQSEAELTEYSQQIQTASQELAQKQSQYSYLESTLNASINLDQVEKVAKELGLVKLDSSQITYIRLENEAVLTTQESSFEQWKTTIQEFCANILDYLDP